MPHVLPFGRLPSSRGPVRAALAALALMLAPGLVRAADYQSGFGFTFQVSDDWLVLTRPQVQRVFKDETKASLGLPTIDRESFDGILQRVQSGQVEFIFDRRHSTPDFNNNISIQRMPARKDSPEEAARSSCPSLQSTLHGIMGTEVTVTSCGARKVGDASFVAYEYRLPALGVTNVQFEIPFGFQGTLVIVGGSNDAGLANLRAVQLAIAGSAVRSLRRPADTASDAAR
jgi:hypothetical protein